MRALLLVFVSGSALAAPTDFLVPPSPPKITPPPMPMRMGPSPMRRQMLQTATEMEPPRPGPPPQAEDKNRRPMEVERFRSTTPPERQLMGPRRESLAEGLNGKGPGAKWRNSLRKSPGEQARQQGNLRLLAASSRNRAVAAPAAEAQPQLMTRAAEPAPPARKLERHKVKRKQANKPHSGSGSGL